MDLSATMELPDVKRRARKMIRKQLVERMESGHSYSPESLPAAAAAARRKAAVDSIWERLEEAGLVKLEVKPDDDVDLESLEGDMFDVEMHEDTVPGGARTILAQQKRFRERVERDGVWGVVGSYRAQPSGKWIHADSCWGMEGYESYEDSEIADDVKWATLKALVELADLHERLAEAVEEWSE